MLYLVLPTDGWDGAPIPGFGFLGRYWPSLLPVAEMTAEEIADFLSFRATRPDDRILRPVFVRVWSDSDYSQDCAVRMAELHWELPSQDDVYAADAEAVAEYRRDSALAAEERAEARSLYRLRRSRRDRA